MIKKCEMCDVYPTIGVVKAKLSKTALFESSICYKCMKDTNWITFGEDVLKVNFKEEVYSENKEST